MARNTTPPIPSVAAQRAALINGKTPAPSVQPIETAKREFIRYAGRHGTRLIRVSSIDQIIFNPGQVGGIAWFMRVGSQEFPIDEALARSLTTELTGWPSEEVFP